LKKDNNEVAELRGRAEEFSRPKTTKGHLPLTEADSRRLLHELEVHRIELEMQNAELRHSRDDAETALEKYTELYDFAPVGYLTFARNGVIRGVNLAGAALLGIERSRLIGRRFSLLVTDARVPPSLTFSERYLRARAKRHAR
jgi:PAS domain-containing protein